MKNNWTKTVASINREKFAIPDGWDTRDKVAADLQCAPDRVADLLKPGIASGQIERQDFPVWDDARRMTVRVVCYRVAGTKSETAAPATAVRVGRRIDSGKFAKIERALRRDPRKTDALIAKNSNTTKAEVAEVRASLGL